MNQEPALQATIDGDRLRLAASGSWTTPHAERLEELLAGVPAAPASVTVNAAGVAELDTLGAWLLDRVLREREASGRAELIDLPAQYRTLYGEVHGANRSPPAPAARPPRGPVAGLNYVGVWASQAAVGFLGILAVLGAIGAALARVIVRPASFRFTSTVHQLDRVGWNAIPIIFLITFLIGGIIAQQGIFHFRRFGAEDYVVDLVGILVLREIGVLIVAIMVAGRSGSSYTAELGSMKMREEIDALRTMSLDPAEVLMLPRVLALIVALPILTFIGSMSALFGGGLVAWFYGGMSPEIYVERLKDAISVTHFEVGMIKAPFMALVIGVVACYQGLQVQGSAESLGLQTTASVVKSIFLVIVLDGLFAVFFASIGM